jgi:hypothetical protein
MLAGALNQGASTQSGMASNQGAAGTGFLAIDATKNKK